MQHTCSGRYILLLLPPGCETQCRLWRTRRWPTGRLYYGTRTGWYLDGECSHLAHYLLHPGRTWLSLRCPGMVGFAQRPNQPVLHEGSRLGRSSPQHCWVRSLDLQSGVSYIQPINGLGHLIIRRSDSTTAKKGWSTPQIPSLLSVSLVLLGLFVYYERWRESKNKSVLMPMSMWRYPNARMGSVISLVFFGWWAFNTMGYLATL